MALRALEIRPAGPNWQSNAPIATATMDLGDEEFPTIAGMDEAALLKELLDFKSGERVDEIGDMTDVVEFLSEQDMADVAAYFSQLPGAEQD